MGALASDGLKVEGTDMQGADSKQANVGSKHMFGDFGLKGPDGCLDDCGCFSGLISPVKAKISKFQISVSTFLSCPRDTVSEMSQLRRYGQFLWPLLSQLSMDDATCGF